MRQAISEPSSRTINPTSIAPFTALLTCAASRSRKYAITKTPGPLGGTDGHGEVLDGARGACRPGRARKPRALPSAASDPRGRSSPDDQRRHGAASDQPSVDEREVGLVASRHVPIEEDLEDAPDVLVEPLPGERVASLGSGSGARRLPGRARRRCGCRAARAMPDAPRGPRRAPPRPGWRSTRTGCEPGGPLNMRRVEAVAPAGSSLRRRRFGQARRPGWGGGLRFASRGRRPFR